MFWNTFNEQTLNYSIFLWLIRFIQSMISRILKDDLFILSNKICKKISNSGPDLRQRWDESKPLSLRVREYQLTRLTYQQRMDEIKWTDWMIWEWRKWWNDICDKAKQENPWEKPVHTPISPPWTPLWSDRNANSGPQRCKASILNSSATKP